MVMTVAFSSTSEMRGPTLASAACSAEALIVKGVYLFQTDGILDENFSGLIFKEVPVLWVVGKCNVVEI